MGYLAFLKEEEPVEFAKKFGEDTEPESEAICKVCGETFGEHSGLTCPRDIEEY